MKETTPLVSVLMPVYNGMPYLPLAVESILNQTFKDFEFIIVDDCSNDDSLVYLQAIHDKRVVLVPLSQNKGVTGALQEGMNKVRGKYIARLDADDIAKPDRLLKQVEYMDNNPDVGLLGSSIDLIDSSGRILKHVNLAKNDIEIRWRMMVKNPFVHSTVMFRYELVNTHHLGYTLQYGEDYKLWTELIRYSKGYISKDKLIQYRTHNQSWTFTKENEQASESLNIAALQLGYYIMENHNKLMGFVQWMKGQIVSKNKVEYKEMYINLLIGFLKRHHTVLDARFIGQCLTRTRKRLGYSVLLRKDLLKIYLLFFRRRFSEIYLKQNKFLDSKK